MNAELDGDVIARVRASLSAVAASTPVGRDRWDAVAAGPGRRQRPLAVSLSAAAAVVGVVAAAAGTGVILTREHARPADGGTAGNCVHSRSLDGVVATREQLAKQFRGLMYMLPRPPVGYHLENASGVLDTSCPSSARWSVLYGADGSDDSTEGLWLVVSRDGWTPPWEDSRGTARFTSSPTLPAFGSGTQTVPAVSGQVTVRGTVGLLADSAGHSPAVLTWSDDGVHFELQQQGTKGNPRELIGLANSLEPIAANDPRIAGPPSA